MNSRLKQKITLTLIFAMNRKNSSMRPKLSLLRRFEEHVEDSLLLDPFNDVKSLFPLVEIP